MPYQIYDLQIFWSFVVPYKFKDYFCYFCKKYHWNLDWDYTESVDGFRLYGYFNSFNSFDP